MHFQFVLKNKSHAVSSLIGGLTRERAMTIDPRQADAAGAAMVVVLTYWLSYEYVRDPRRALEPEQAQSALLRGAQHVLHQLAPYLEPAQRQHLMGLSSAYQR
jgi:hypothetical protein